MQKHVRILGWLYIVLGVIDLLIGAMMFGLLSSVGLMAGDAHALGALTVIGGMLGTALLVMAIPNLIVGIGFLKNWGGWVIIVACVLALFNLAKFPWGTVVSVYTFWVAWKLYQAQDDTVREPTDPMSGQ